MAGHCVATLSSTDGWEVKSPARALGLHFMYWLTSRRSQDKLLGDVPSFYYLWAKHSTTPETMVEKTREAWKAYVKELFPVSEVEVQIITKPDINSVYTLGISAGVVVDGVRYDMAKSVLITGSLFEVLDQGR